MNRQEMVACILGVARSQVGVTELSGKNDGIPAERYMSGDALPWCAGFVLWVFRSVGAPLPGNQFRNRAVTELEGQLSLLATEIAAPQPGALIFFKKTHISAGPSGHVGIVESISPIRESGEYRITTIEGNSKNMVKRNYYDSNSVWIKGYYQWPKDAVDAFTYNVANRKDT